MQTLCCTGLFSPCAVYLGICLSCCLQIFHLAFQQLLPIESFLLPYKYAMFIFYYLGSQKERLLHKERVRMSRQLCSRLGGLVLTCVRYFHPCMHPLAEVCTLTSHLKIILIVPPTGQKLTCINDLFVAVINTMPKTNLVKKGFVLAYGSREG